MVSTIAQRLGNVIAKIGCYLTEIKGKRNVCPLLPLPPKQCNRVAARGARNIGGQNDKTRHLSRNAGLSQLASVCQLILLIRRFGSGDVNWECVDARHGRSQTESQGEQRGKTQSGGKKRCNSKK